MAASKKTKVLFVKSGIPVKKAYLAGQEGEFPADEAKELISLGICVEIGKNQSKLESKAKPSKDSKK